MSESAALVNVFIHGIAAGAMIVSALVIARSRLSRDVRIAAVLAGVSIVAWIICEITPLWRAMGHLYLLQFLTFPVAAIFWLLLLAIFDDWRVTPATLAPVGLLVVMGFAQGQTVGSVNDWIWASRNILGALLAIHAGTVVLRGWRGDLVEGRRRFRAVLFGLSCLYVVLITVAALANKLDPSGPWLMVVVGQLYGGLLLSLLIIAMALVALQVWPPAFGASRRVEVLADARGDPADNHDLARLQAVVTAEGWRREGLTIGDLARELDLPEHRLRRLINQRLGHRNFAEFVNGHRIEAAKVRLGDLREARTTVAAIAFDLGYGSLGPFNRAFRTATGVTPTDYRRAALAEGSPELNEAG